MPASNRDPALARRSRPLACRARVHIDRSYADAIDRAGGVALYLPIQSDDPGLVASIDGLLLPGGDDFPSETPLAPEIEALLDLVPAAQLAFDRMLFERRAGAPPILGICYMQLMAVRWAAPRRPPPPSAGSGSTKNARARHP
jgi:gamma-glutamyl-gamma-aminobutyrate hydrolase PuuD